MRTNVLLIPALLASLQLTACMNDEPPSDEQELSADQLDDAELDAVALAATALPAAPSLASEFIGCSGSVAQYSVTFSSTGATSYDVDYRRGTGAWATLYDGASKATRFATSNATTSVTFRARACNSAGCSAFHTGSSFIPESCAGGGSL